MTFDNTIAALEAVVDHCSAEGDRVGYFAAMYLAVTNTMRERAGAGRFADAARMERFATGFAGTLPERPRRLAGRCPVRGIVARRVQGDPAGRPIILQHLLLGMNAHINLDLGVAAVRGW